MNKQKLKASEGQTLGWRFKVGVGLFVFSIILPLAGVPIVAVIDLSTTAAASASALLLGLAELSGLAAIAVMGKSGYAYIKQKFSRFLKTYGPPQEVSRIRYMIGLVMFCIPLILGWASPYLIDLFPTLTPSTFTWAITGDILFLTSLFVLGGNFWDKLQSLFVHSAHAHFKKS